MVILKSSYQYSNIAESITPLMKRKSSCVFSCRWLSQLNTIFHRVCLGYETQLKFDTRHMQKL